MSMRTAAALCSLLLTSLASAQQVAVLHNGAALTQKQPLEVWSVEGPLWNIDAQNRTLEALGRIVQIPLSIDGQTFIISGTEVVNEDGGFVAQIGAANFDRLSDVNAATRDFVMSTYCPECGPVRFGPVRSIFSTTEARLNPVGALMRDPEIQTIIEDNYFGLAVGVYLRYMDELPVSFLGKLGVRNTQGQYPTSPFQLPPRTQWKYPATSGATLKMSGHVYVDAKGNEFLIPDTGNFLEFAENVAVGPVTSFRRGDESTPDSLRMGNLLVTMNPDPRLEVMFTGIGETPITQDLFFNAAAKGLLPAEVTAAGYLVGEHMMFATHIDAATFYHPSMGIVVSADRFDVRVDRGEMRWRGILAPSEGYTLSAEIGKSIEPITLVPSVDAPGATYDAKIEGLNLKGITTLDLVVRDSKGVEVHRQTFDFSEGIRD